MLSKKLVPFVAIVILLFVCASCHGVAHSPAAVSTATPRSSSDATASISATPSSSMANPTSVASIATPVDHTDAECNPSPSQPWKGALNGFTEVQGTASSGELWALVEGPVPVDANDGDKIIWKMSGSAGGTLRLLLVDSDGNRLEPLHGPESHGGSNWSRPGNEWGSVLEFPHAGCWVVQASSGNNTGHIWFDVIRPRVSSTATPTPVSATTLYPVPASCTVTPLSAPQPGRWGFTARWWTGTGLMASSSSSVLYERVGNELRWQLGTRAPLTLTGHNLSQPDQSMGVTNDLSYSLSVTYITDVEFPSPGCWQIHAKAGTQAVQFTVYVYPYACLPADQRPPGSTSTCAPPKS